MIANLKLSQSQHNFLFDQARISLGLAGRGGGKTWVGALWATIQMLNYPGSIGLIAASNPAQLFSVATKQLTDILDLCGIQWIKGSDPPWFESKLTSHTNVLSLENGSQCHLRSFHERGADRAIAGLSVQWAWLDESRTLDELVFDRICPAIRGGNGPWKIRLTTSPNGHDWQYKRFVNPETKIPDATIHRWTTKDNEHNLPPNFIENLRNQLSSDLFRQEVLGEFVDCGRGARVCRFDMKRHVNNKEFDPAKHYLAWVMDYNVSPLVGLVAACSDRERSIHVIDEFLMKDNGKTDRLCESFAIKWSQISKHVSYYGDDAGGHRDTRNSESDLVIMKNVLTRYFPNHRNLNDGFTKGLVIDGINTMNSMLDPAAGPVRLTVHPRCRYLIEDLNNVVYKNDGSRQVDKSDSQRTHGFDALRYLANRLYGLKNSGLKVIGY